MPYKHECLNGISLNYLLEIANCVRERLYYCIEKEFTEGRKNGLDTNIIRVIMILKCTHIRVDTVNIVLATYEGYYAGLCIIVNLSLLISRAIAHSLRAFSETS